MRISFTATRRLPEKEPSDPSIRGRSYVSNVLRGLEGADEFTTGGAPGGDQFIALELLALFPQALHRIVLPRIEKVTEPHYEFVRTHGGPFEVIVTGLSPLYRNGVILDHGDMLYGFPWRPENQDKRSGTWATIREAGRRDMPREVRVLCRG